MIAMSASIDGVQHIDLHPSSLRGRRPVRADRGLRADEKRIRTRSAILDKNQTQTGLASINNRVFGTDALFIRTKDTVGARSAQ